MKRFSFKSFLIGFLSCVLLSSFSYAAQYKPIQVAVDTVKKIIINGADKTPTDFKPFLYEGKTYVPLAYIAEALGANVKWNSKTSTIYINNNGSSKEDTSINGFAYEEMNAVGKFVTKEYNGNKVLYFEGMQPDKYRNDTASSTLSYDLKDLAKPSGSSKERRVFKDLKGKFGFFSGGNHSDDIHAQLIVYDEKDHVLYQSDFIRGNTDPINLNVDVSGVKTLKLEIKATSYKDGAKANIGFVDLRLSHE